MSQANAKNMRYCNTYFTLNTVVSLYNIKGHTERQSPTGESMYTWSSCVEKYI